MALRDHARIHEVAVLFAFLCAVGLTAALELRWLVHRWRNRKARPRPPFWPLAGERTQKALTALLNLAAFGGLFCILYGRLIEPKWLAVTSFELPLREDPSGERPGPRRPPLGLPLGG